MEPAEFAAFSDNFRLNLRLKGLSTTCVFTLFLTIDQIIFFALLSLGASVVNGGLGYGYSSISIPLAILVLASKIVNPAYVLLELFLNITMLIFVGRKRIRSTIRRSLPVILALLPGVVIGSLLLSYALPIWVRFTAYVVMLPLILLQAAGFRRAIKGEFKAGVSLGFGTGMLYSLTTISGPPLALFWSNQGLPKNELKAAIAEIRVAESSFTVVAYYFLGLFSATTTIPVFSVIAPPVLVGIPIGMFLVKRLSLETFTIVARNFDAIIVGYGLSRTIGPLFGISDLLAYMLWIAVIVIVLALLVRYLRNRRSIANIGVIQQRGQDMIPETPRTNIKSWFTNKALKLCQFKPVHFHNP